MTLSLELGQISDDAVRRAFQQISLQWPTGSAVAAVVAALPPNAPLGALAYLTTGTAGLYVRLAGGWVQV